jgi:hypothetical protein
MAQGIKNYDENMPPCLNDECNRSATWVAVKEKSPKVEFACSRHLGQAVRAVPGSKAESAETWFRAR